MHFARPHGSPPGSSPPGACICTGCPDDSDALARGQVTGTLHETTAKAPCGFKPLGFENRL